MSITIRIVLAAVALTVLGLAGCAGTGHGNVAFPSATLEGVASPVENVRGLLARPAGDGPFPAVILLHTCGGVQRHVSRDWPAFLTGQGYAALTVDTFGSRGAGRCPEARRRLGSATMWRDAYGALDYLAALPEIDPNRIAVMGFSLGGFAVEAMAGKDLASPSGRNFRAGIVVYGYCRIGGEPRFPVLEIIGDRDFHSGFCPVEPRDNIQVEILAGAYHGFDNPQIVGMQTAVGGGHPMKYDQSATNRARQLAVEFLNRHLSQ